MMTACKVQFSYHSLSKDGQSFGGFTWSRDWWPLTGSLEFCEKSSSKVSPNTFTIATNNTTAAAESSKKTSGKGGRNSKLLSHEGLIIFQDVAADKVHIF